MSDTPSTTPMSERDLARTPPSLFKKLDDIYHFNIDAAASEDDKLKVVYCSDFLEEDVHLEPSDCAYINPPYSRGNIDRFIKKGYEESLQGAVVVMLLPMDASTVVFHNYCMKAQRWIIFKPRVKFLRPSGIPFDGSPKFATFACVFDMIGRRSQAGPLIDSWDWRK